jgi:prephenate dehydratase
MATLTIGYLGPEGSNSHQAALSTLGFLNMSTDAVTFTPYATLSLLLEATAAGEHTLGIMPYENALEGAVVEVLEALGNPQNTLYTHAEFLQPIEHSLLVQSSDSETKLHTIYSHAMALNQCKNSLRTKFGADVQLIPTASTAHAATRLKAMVADEAKGVGVLATQVAANMNDLHTLDLDMSDALQNITRFFMVSNTSTWPAHLPSLPNDVPDKTSMCVSLHEYPGVLTEYLQVFQRYWVNLTKIESRPTRQTYGDYHFFLDAEGDIRLPNEGRLLSELTARSRAFHMQGPYKCLGLPVRG